VLILSACSSDDVAQVFTDEFITIRGTVFSTANPEPGPGEAGVKVEGIYSDTNPLNPEIVTVAGGVFNLEVLKNTAVSMRASKNGFATLNSAKEALSVDVMGADFELPNTTEAEGAISDAFGAGPTLPGQAWLAVNVVDGFTGDDVAGIAISVTGAAGTFVYTDCAGIGTGALVTVVDANPCDRGGAMYFAYFDTDSTEVTVSDGTSSQLAPVRRGEVTFLEFEQ